MLSSFVTVPPTDDPDILAAAAGEAARQQQWDQALELWQSLLDHFPNHIAAQFGRCNALVELGRFDQAETLFAQLTKQYPDRVQGLHGLAQVAIRSQQWQLALERCARLQEKFPQHLQGYVWQANALIELGHFDQAEGLFNRLCEQYPDRIQGPHGLAQVAIRSQQWELALERCARLQDAFPQQLQGYICQANALVELGHFDQAEVLFNRLCEQYPDRVQGPHGLAQVAIRSQQWQLALERCATLQENFPQHLHGYLWQANALIELGRVDQAETLFTQLTQQYPDRVEGFHGLAQVAIRSQQWQLALERCAELQDKFPQHLRGHLWQADALIELGHFDQAEALFNRLCEQYPDRVDGFHGLAQVAKHRQDWSLALARFDTVIQQFPEHFMGYQGKAQVLIQQEDYQTAAALLQEIAPQHPRNPSIIQSLITVAYHTQQWDFTLEQVQDFILANPSLCPTLASHHQLFKILDRLINLLLDSHRLSETAALLNHLTIHAASPAIIALWQSLLTFHQGDYPHAEQTCLAVLEENPDIADAIYLQLTRYAWQAFDLEKVLHWCDQITPSASQPYAESAVLTYQALIRQGQIDRAKATLQQLISWHPAKPVGYVFLAEVLCFHDHQYGETLKVCNQAIQRSLTDDRLYSYRTLALAALGETEQAQQVATRYLKRAPEGRLVRMALVEACRQHQAYEQALQNLNQWLGEGDFAPLASTGPRCEFNIQYLHCEPGNTVEVDAQLSVIMTTYRRDEWLPVAINSILKQTYRNLELIIVDDCSPDDTFDYLQSIAATDNRIRLLRLDQNSGTYVAKNYGMAMAQGQFVSFMDADDWLHPQTLERQIARLQDPETLGVMSGFFRVNENSQIEFKPEGPAGQAHITLCFKRDPVLTTLGYFDAVRTGADTEYLERIQLIFGRHTIKRLKFPLLVSTRHPNSITGGNALSFPWYGPGSVDSLYAASFRLWHRQMHTQSKVPFIPHPLNDRCFEAPTIILP